MSVQQLMSHLGECRRRLSEFRSRQDYLALSCAILRMEGSGGTILYEHPFARVFGDRPFHDRLDLGQSENPFALAFYPCAEGVHTNRIRPALNAVEAITGEIHPLLRALPKPIHERLQLPTSDNWWREVFHLAWHFPRPFLRATRWRLLANGGAPSGRSDETFAQMHGTGGRSDLLPGLIFSDLEHDLCTCSEAALGAIIDALERYVQIGPTVPLESQGVSVDQRRTFDQLRTQFFAGTLFSEPSLECKLFKLADSFDTPPASEWGGLEMGGCHERFVMLSQLNDQKEIAQIRGPATNWFCEIAERAGDALPSYISDRPILFDDLQRGLRGPRAVLNRGALERWVGFVFSTLSRYAPETLHVFWGTPRGPLSYGFATLDRDLCAASVLAIDLARLTTAAEDASNRERETCSPFLVPSMEEQGFQWAEERPAPPPPPQNYTLRNLLNDLRQFSEAYQRDADHIRQHDPIIQGGEQVQQGAFVSGARECLLRIPGFTELRELARSLWNEEISFAVGRRIVDALVQRSNGSLSTAAAEGLTLAEAASKLTPEHEGNEMPAPIDGEARRQIADALETWKRVLYPNLPGGPLPLTEVVELTNRIVTWRDRHAPHFDVTPLDEVRRILLRRAAGETTPEQVLRTTGERAARICDRIKAWLQTVEDSSTIAMKAPVDFLIVTALEEERDAVLLKLPGYKTLPPSEDDVRCYYAARIDATYSDGSKCAYSVALVSLANMGRVQAAATASDAIRYWRPRYVMLVGIAGGLESSGVVLGDILIANLIVDCELQEITEDGPEIRWNTHQVDARLLEFALNFSAEKWHTLVCKKRPKKGEPARRKGTIVTGDKVIAVNDILESYKEQNWPKLIGVEMEAGGVALTAHQSAIRPGFFMVRCVSDLLSNKNQKNVKAWRSYACDVAASYAIAMVQSGPVPPTSTQQGV
jgi:nucleoside phosphorylase